MTCAQNEDFSAAHSILTESLGEEVHGQARYWVMRAYLAELQVSVVRGAVVVGPNVLSTLTVNMTVRVTSNR